jgi:hypothetical protein
VFITLCRSAYERHWHAVFGENGDAMLESLQKGEHDAWEVAKVLLTPEQQERLRGVIADWIKAHPDQFVVEGVRFTDFAARAGEVSEKESGNARGLMGNVRAATLTAEKALLLSERAMFLANHMPPLLRTQARIGASEIMSDSLQQLEAAKSLIDETKSLGPLLGQLQSLVESAERTSHETRQLIESMQPMLRYAAGTTPDTTTPGATPSDTTMPGTAPQGTTTPDGGAAQPARPPGLQDALAAANRLTDQTLALVTHLRVLADKLPSDPEGTLGRMTGVAQSLAKSGFYYLLALGAAWSLLFWGGYYIARRLLARSAR